MACSIHYINCKVLTKLLLLDIHAKAMLAQNSPTALKEKILAQKNAASMEQTKALRATLAAVDKRLAELEKLVVSAYEDKVKGVMPEVLCVQLMNHYEDERRGKLEQRTQLTAQLEVIQEDEQATDEWLAVIRDYAQLEELDRPTLPAAGEAHRGGREVRNRWGDPPGHQNLLQLCRVCGTLKSVLLYARLFNVRVL